MTIEYLDEIDEDLSHEMFILDRGSKGNKILLDGEYTIKDLRFIIKLVFKHQYPKTAEALEEMEHQE